MKATERAVLDQFLSEIEDISVHRSETLGPSLKKPLLVLLVLSRIHSGKLKENRVRLPDVHEELGDLIAKHGGRHGKSGPAPEMPFYHLKTAPFWDLHLSEEPSGRKGRTPPRRILNASSTHGSLRADVFSLLSSSKEARREATETLLKKWWPADEQVELRRRLGI